jgi:hypothetical protein
MFFVLPLLRIVTRTLPMQLCALAVALSLFSSLSKAQTPVTAGPYDSYFPLAVGNWWHFDRLSGHDTGIETIVAYAKAPDDSMAYQFDQFRGKNNAYLRWGEDGKLYMYGEGRKSMYLDFAAATGASWRFECPFQIGLFWDITVMSRKDTVETPLGRFTDVVRFYFKGVNMSDNDWSESYARNVGPVLRTMYGFGIIDDTLAGYDVSNSPSGTGGTPVPVSSAVSLLNPFPLPAMGMAIIPVFVLRPAGSVNLSITDIRGRTVLTVHNGALTAGRHEFRISERLPRGVYIVHLVTPGSMECKKLIVNRR